MSTHLLPRPKSIEDARGEFLRAMGDPRTLNKYLCAALVIAGIGVIGLIGLNFKTAMRQTERVVVMIDPAGRAIDAGVTTTNSTIPPNAVKYFLIKFAHEYYGRNRVTLKEDVASSMLFLSQDLARQREQEERKTKSLEHFVASGDDEVAIQVNNIVLGDLTKAPYSAQVDMDKIYHDRSGNESKHEKFVVSITFGIATEVPNSIVPINPLGFYVTSLHEDQAF